MPSDVSFQVITSDRLKSWSRCQKQYEFQYVKALHWPADTRSFALGKDIHKLLDYQARELDVTQVVQTASPLIQQMWTALLDYPLVTIPAVSSEWAFHIYLDNDLTSGLWLSGRVDRIVWLEQQKKLCIVDWKTGTAVPKDPENDWQTQVYLYAVYEARHQLVLPEKITHEQLCFTYVEVPTQKQSDQKQPIQIKEKTVLYTAEKHRAARQRILDTVLKLYNATEYVLPARCPDKYCAYSSVCGI